ncbi:hypothetical protein AltI4_25340 [Alteromonas sp. I4]|nr:hypothetical protein AltI4_25340 [Alteromonas sp. I4]
MRSFGLILLLFSSQVFSENICPVNTDIPEDVRMDESYFNKESAETALKKLQGIISEQDNMYEWITIPNATKVIHGYILKRDAINSGKQQYLVDAFCSFYKSEGWFYD